MHSNVVSFAAHGQGSIAQTDPDENPLDQGEEPISSAPVVNDPKQSFPQPNAPEQPHTWLMQPGSETAPAQPIDGSGQWSSAWDGSKPLNLELPNGAQIRSLYFPIVTPETVQIFAGASSTGVPIVPALQPVGVVPIPPGHSNLTIVAPAAFGGSFPVYATSDILDPTPNESVSVSLATTPITIVEPKSSSLLAGATIAVPNDLWKVVYTATQDIAVTDIVWLYNGGTLGASGAILRIGVNAAPITLSQNAVAGGEVHLPTPTHLKAGDEITAAGFGTWAGGPSPITFTIFGYVL